MESGTKKDLTREHWCVFQILTGLNNVLFKEIITVKLKANHTLMTLTHIHQRSRNLQRKLQDLHFTCMKKENEDRKATTSRLLGSTVAIILWKFSRYNETMSVVLVHITGALCSWTNKAGRKDHATPFNKMECWSIIYKWPDNCSCLIEDATHPEAFVDTIAQPLLSNDTFWYGLTKSLITCT